MFSVRICKQWLLVLFALAAGAALASHVSAAVIGQLNIANTAGGGITLNSTSIDFLLPAAGGNGAMASGIGTNISYAGGGPLLSGSAGLVKDFAAASLPVIDFMTFATDPLLHFDLTGIGPGVANTVAVNVLDPNTAPSSPSIGSPFILQSTATGTALTFTVNGIARDNSSPDSLWSGLFTTQIAGVTPFQVQQTLLNDGSISSTYSGSFVASGFIPEPSTAALVFAGILPLFRRRHSSIGN